jgi:hypothetical protein
MGFFNSVINQIGRDVGRTISNKLLKDTHSIPIRYVGQKTQTQERAEQLTTISTVDKLINSIDLTQSPKLVIRKLGAILVDFEISISKILSDDYISLEEELQLATVFMQILYVFDKIEKQFIINNLDTKELFEIYENHFEKPILSCINHLENQEDNWELKEKYKTLYEEIKNVVK